MEKSEFVPGMLVTDTRTNLDYIVETLNDFHHLSLLRRKIERGYQIVLSPLAHYKGHKSIYCITETAEAPGALAEWIEEARIPVFDRHSGEELIQDMDVPGAERCFEPLPVDQARKIVEEIRRRREAATTRPKVFPLEGEGIQIRRGTGVAAKRRRDIEGAKLEALARLEHEEEAREWVHETTDEDSSGPVDGVDPGHGRDPEDADGGDDPRVDPGA